MPRLWALSDDTLSVPLGTIVDVAVAPDRAVYLLDTQNLVVWRIAPDGKELTSLGRGGEGPGEFMHPLLVSAPRSGMCVVIQDFHAPAVCLMDDGGVCNAPDVAVVRDRFLITQFIATRSDANCYLIAAITSDRAPGPTATPADLGLGHSLFRLSPGEAQFEVLFSDRADLCTKNSVRLREYAAAFLDRYWDADRRGRIIFADPAGAYRVTIGHPADGESRMLELQESPTDARNIERLARSTGQRAAAIPRIAAIYWIDDAHFLVKPMGALEGPTSSRGGVFELFDTAGKSYGRRVLSCEYEPSNDGFFVRSGLLVVVRGGRSAARAEVNQKAEMLGKRVVAPGDGDPAPDEIQVVAYDLVAHYVGRSAPLR